MADIVLKWRGQEYRIPDSRAFEAGAAVEEVVTLSDLQSFATRPRFFVIAKAMGALLRFAGVKVSDSEVKREIDASILKASKAGADVEAAKDAFAVNAISQLMQVLFEGAPNDDEEGGSVGETSAS
jgi:hypothetical protein